MFLGDDYSIVEVLLNVVLILEENFGVFNVFSLYDLGVMDIFSDIFLEIFLDIFLDIFLFFLNIFIFFFRYLY